MAKKLYAISEDDRQPFLDLVAWWRSRGSTLDLSLASVGGPTPFVCLKRPDGWDLGICRRLVRDNAWSFVWDLHLLGYPAIAGKNSFAIQWTHTDGTVVKTPAISVDATAQEMAEAQPRSLPTAIVSGGKMRANDDDTTGDEYSTGRWFFAFAEDPEWTPEIVDLNSVRLVGRTHRTHLRPSGSAHQFFSLASTDGPTPLHPGTLAVAWDFGGKLMMALHEPRIFQGSAFQTAKSAEYSWAIGPFSQLVTEGVTATIEISCSASNAATELLPQTTSIDLTWDYGTTDTDDWDDTLSEAITAAIGTNAAWAWDGSRLSATFQPSETTQTLSVALGTRDEGTVEGTESATLSASNPLSTTGVADLTVDSATIELRDANAILWDVTGSAAVSPGNSGTYNLIVTGVYKAGVYSAITLTRTGTVSDAHTEDWRAAITTAIAARDEFAFDEGTDTLTLTAQADGTIDPLTFSIEFTTGASGTWTLTIADAGSTAELDVTIGNDAVTTEVS